MSRPSKADAADHLDPAVAADLDELLKPMIIPALASDEFTVYTIAVRYGQTRDIAKRMVEMLVGQGRAVPVGMRKESRCPAQAWKWVKPTKV
jgi:hypothetical protein